MCPGTTDAPQHWQSVRCMRVEADRDGAAEADDTNEAADVERLGPTDVSHGCGFAARNAPYRAVTAASRFMPLTDRWAFSPLTER
mmetsp:Transcript_46391/g.143186  ORF Transcript_46391/g.143186 Transcript_46391/m.143186 type:complete len:85 (-) Transcript_46391:755-1009(-)